MPPANKRINIELYLSLSAIFLSLAALIVSIFQTKIDREQQKASVWPYLQILGLNADQAFHYGLENKGVGPAIIKKYSIRYKGKSYPTFRSLLWEQIGTKTAVATGFSNTGPGEVFKSGENVELVYVARNDSIVQRVEAMVADTAFHLQIHYSDIYGNCWLLDRNKVKELSHCPD